jgi:hypothetical protein
MSARSCVRLSSMAVAVSLAGCASGGGMPFAFSFGGGSKMAASLY